MAKVKIVVNNSGVREIRTSPEVQREILRRAERIKNRADGFGSGKYSADVQAGRNYAHGRVSTTDARSYYSNRKHNSILKSIDAGRG